MQQIERYGVIALIFLLVTIVAVSFWGENGEGGLWSRLSGKEPSLAQAAEAERHDPAVSANSHARSMGRELPLTTPDMQHQASPRQDPNARQARRRYPRRAANVDAQPSSAQPSASSARARPMPRRRSSSPTAAPAETATVAARSAPAQTAERAAPARAVAQRPLSEPKSAPTSYVVQKGDSLSLIAQRMLGSSRRWTEIQALNGDLDPQKLAVGMKLRLPAAQGEARAAAPAAAREPAAVAQRATTTEVATSGSSYTVRKGDTLSAIAQRELGDARRWPDIVAANPGIDANRLYVGVALRMPAGGRARAQDVPLMAQAGSVTTARRSSDKPRVR